jgi:hypothetical protein
MKLTGENGDYAPYGPEWEKEMMRWTKKELVAQLRDCLSSPKESPAAKRTIVQAKDLFEGITCLRAEGVEFHTIPQVLDLIARDAHRGYDLCKAALEETREERRIDGNKNN